MPYYINNIPYYGNNMYTNFDGRSCCSNNSSSYPGRYQNGRFIPGGFLIPFGLGLLSAPLVYRPNYYPRPYYYNYPMYY